MYILYDLRYMELELTDLIESENKRRMVVARDCGKGRIGKQYQTHRNIE